MMRNSEVPQVMTLVEAALLRPRTAQEQADPIFITGDGVGDMDIARLRHRAHIHLDFHSGSARPVVGRAVVAAKRVVRRGLRWYMQPVAEQQTGFNHAVLDLLERMRVENERLRGEVDRLRRSVTAPAHGADAAAAARPGAERP